MSPYEYIGFVAFALNVAGNWLLTDKRPSGWAIRIASNVAQLAYAMCMGSQYLLLNSVMFGGINVRGWWKWKLEALQTTTVFGSKVGQTTRS